MYSQFWVSGRYVNYQCRVYYGEEEHSFDNYEVLMSSSNPKSWDWVPMKAADGILGGAFVAGEKRTGDIVDFYIGRHSYGRNYTYVGVVSSRDPKLVTACKINKLHYERSDYCTEGEYQILVSRS